MKRFIAGTITTLAVVLMQIPAFANDERIAKQIADSLRAQQAAAKLQDFNIGVKVEKGTVTMSGQVSQADQAMMALDIARRVPGVKLVVNDMFINQNGTAQRVNVITETTPEGQNSIRQAGAFVPPVPEVAATQKVESAIAGFVSTQPAPPIGSGIQMHPTPATVNDLPEYPTQTVVRQIPTTQPVAVPQRRSPIAFAPSHSIALRSNGNPQIHQANFHQYSVNGPVPSQGVPSGVARAGYDQPQLPGYAWPSYSAYPNYSALTYPQQYSPTAWPYIGPFYPYPQVPLGWRKVTLEWDDGWWFLDFKSK